MMKIKRISLYSKSGERRDVEFNLDSLSIITGASKRGKSSILEIIEYCLGASECTVAHGHIRNSVEWYSITLLLSDHEIFIARRNPPVNHKASEDFYIVQSDIIKLPPFNNLQKNSNKEDLRQRLTIILGLPEQTTEVSFNNTRAPININFKHSIYYYFQNQDEIANKKFLFHRQGEPFIPQAIKDTFPYFLGAAEDNRLTEISELRDLKSALSKNIKRLKEIESLKGAGYSKGKMLYNEACILGIVPNPIENIPDSILFEELDKLSAWKPSNISEGFDNFGNLGKLEEEFHILRNQKQQVNHRINEIKSYEKVISGFNNITQEQDCRIRSIKLFEKLDAYETDKTYKPLFKKHLDELSNEISKSKLAKPRLQEAVIKLKEGQKEIAGKIKDNRSRYNSLLTANQELSHKRDQDFKIASLIGKISFYLDTINWESNTSDLENKISLLKQQVNELELKLNPDALNERIESQVSIISQDIWRWAKELELEHSEFPIRLDHKKLTIVSETPKGRIPLYQMGSGENWVGYHLITYVALAKWFIEQNRPVANFILFDQPSQVYFPSDKAQTGDLLEIEKDEDRDAVLKMFKWLNEVSKNELRGQCQIVVLDHADIDVEWFQNAICDKKWRGENALIPRSWYT